MHVMRGGWLAFGVMGVAAGRVIAQSDVCETATPLPMGYFTPSVAGATWGGPGASCYAETIPDVWYRYDAEADGVLCLTSCDVGGGGVPWYSVHTGCPATAANEVVCTRADSWECWPMRSTRLEMAVRAGQTYYLRTNSNVRVLTWLEGPRPERSRGPDLITGNIGHWETAYAQLDSLFVAYMFDTTGCNVGDENVPWTAADFSDQHPVIASSMYRVKDGVLEQLGYSWLKHGFASETESFCGYCPQSGYFGYLQPGCADTYVAVQNGTQRDLARRSDVNPTTGIFPYPPTAAPEPSGRLARRIFFPEAKIDPALNVGARYMTEVQYLSAADSAAGHGLNNVSYREFPIGPDRQTVRTKPAVVGWAEMDASVTVRAVDHTDGGYPCRYWVATRVWEIQPGRWRYVYAVFNLNSNRAAGGFAIPRRADVQVLGQEFRFVAAHSGEPYATTPWALATEDSEVRWGSDQNFAQNPDANALRWGTTYTMIVDASTGPVDGIGRLELFMPGSAGEPASLAVGLPVPAQGACIADFNGDLFVDFFDYGAFVSAFERGAEAADVNGDGFLDFFDYGDFVTVFEAGC